MYEENLDGCLSNGTGRRPSSYEGSLDKLYSDVVVHKEPTIDRRVKDPEIEATMHATEKGETFTRESYSKTFNKAPRDEDKYGRPFDEIIDLLNWDVAKSARTSRYLQQCMLADIEATEKAVAELPWPASHSLVVPGAFGECAVNAPSSVRGRLDHDEHSAYKEDSDSEAASLREFEEL
ncbi:unnamed protein product [Dibothriocephalus latus]|uniref:Uncharacterized protein n=1 Tax=Dibothriocephalus latus TaxID=60516 RepID=A0A3P7LHR8_DIBLA|nr:unnamed protein product [Dibothriocephalus latus]